MDASPSRDLSDARGGRYSHGSGIAVRKDQIMIDGIGKAGAGRLGSLGGSIDRAAPAGKSAPVAASQPVSGASTPAGEMAAAGAPVDADKVAAIRAAIAEGRYPVDPEKIARSMIELDLLKGGE
jgi:negative regulator of flagellin synthesis FlgM